VLKGIGAAGGSLERKERKQCRRPSVHPSALPTAGMAGPSRGRRSDLWNSGASRRSISWPFLCVKPYPYQYVSICIMSPKKNTGPLNDMIQTKSNKKLARRPSPNDAEADD